MLMMKIVRHSGSTIQYNTMQSNVKKQREKKKHANQLKAYSSVMKSSKQFFPNDI